MLEEKLISDCLIEPPRLLRFLMVFVVPLLLFCLIRFRLSSLLFSFLHVIVKIS